MDPIDIGLIVGGLALAFAGAALFKYTIAAVGFLGGASAGYFIADYMALEPAVLAGAAVVAGLVGVFVAFSIVATVVAIPGFALGSYVTAKAVGLTGAGLDPELIGLTLVGGLVAAALSGLLFGKVLPILTAFVGAALATQAWTYGAFAEAVAELDPDPVLFEPGVLFYGVFVVGVLVQYGLLELGYAKKAAIPVGMLSRRLFGEEAEPEGEEPAGEPDATTDGGTRL